MKRSKFGLFPTETDDKTVLLYINKVDFRVVNIHDFIYFQYNGEMRLWEAVTAQSSCKPHTIATPFTVSYPLKRRISSNDILSLSPSFVQVHQRYIVNIRMIESVIDNVCRLIPPYQEITHITVSSRYCKDLKSRFPAL